MSNMFISHLNKRRHDLWMTLHGSKRTYESILSLPYDCYYYI